MNFEPTRRRREVAPFTINLLRLAGWRFSFTRAAWVHRIGKGRYGPVFVVRDDVTRAADPTDQTGFAVVTVAESAVAEAEAAVTAAAEAARQRAEPSAPLPRRAAKPAPAEPAQDAIEPGAAEPEPVDQEPADQEPADQEPAEQDAGAPEPVEEEPVAPASPSTVKVDGRPTYPRPRNNPTGLRSVPGSNRRASA